MSGNNDESLATIAHTWMTEWPKIIARAWADPAFLKQLQENPGATAKAAGLPVLPGIELNIDGNASSAVLTLPLPAKPADMSDAHLKRVAETGVHPDASSQTCCC